MGQMMKSLKGHLLAAARELRDPNFLHTVVLIVRHDDEDGALGLVLNRPTKTSIREVWKQVSESPCQQDGMLYVGGPVQGPLMAIHQVEFMMEAEILPGLYFTADPDNLSRLVSGEHAPVAFFVGYSGWGPGQLEREMDEGAWLVAPATAADVFGGEDHSWERLSRRVVSESLYSSLNIKHVPTDPMAN